jgi:hypothetical protein
MVRFINKELGQDLTPIFDQYLRRSELPTLELAFDPAAGTLAYRWRADERGFAMPIQVGDPTNWTTIRPTTDWQLMKAPMPHESFKVATDLYYVNVLTQSGAPPAR